VERKSRREKLNPRREGGPPQVKRGKGGHVLISAVEEGNLAAKTLTCLQKKKKKKKEARCGRRKMIDFIAKKKESALPGRRGNGCISNSLVVALYLGKGWKVSGDKELVAILRD